MQLGLFRQANHWLLATERLSDFENLASPIAWSSLENYLQLSIRDHLQSSIDRLNQKSLKLKRQLYNNEHKNLGGEIQSLRNAFRRTEITLDFFGDAINSRTSLALASKLTALDILAVNSMEKILDQLQLITPPVLTYIDKGLGASILKAGLRLWDGGNTNPVAVIKIVRHNLMRPTALIHETGHQIAHIVGWNEELSQLLQQQLPPDISTIWASWASEIAADAFAFVHTGYASITGLHDVLSGAPSFVFQFLNGDPHPIPYIRVLLGLEMCKAFYGKGLWDETKENWMKTYPRHQVSRPLNHFLETSILLLPKIVQLVINHPMKAFRQKSLAQLISPMEVQPKRLLDLMKTINGLSLKSSYQLRELGLQLLALAGWQMAINPKKMREILKQQEQWMMILGNTHSFILK